MLLKNSLVPQAAGIEVSLVPDEVLPTVTSCLLCRVLRAALYEGGEGNLGGSQQNL